jgi:RNA polymerase sigma-70 factor (ECF subfamily)
MLQETDIQNLIRAAQKGDSESFGQIYSLYARQIYNFLFSKLKHRETTEDIVHTVFLTAWTNLHSYKPHANAKFSTWLFQIANFTLIDHWRTKKPTAELTEIENLAQFAQDPKFYEEYEYLWIAISELPLEYQTVLDLRFRQNLSVKETAQILGKSQVGVRVIQHRALKAIGLKLKNREIF